MRWRQGRCFGRSYRASALPMVRDPRLDRTLPFGSYSAEAIRVSTAHDRVRCPARLNFELSLHWWQGEVHPGRSRSLLGLTTWRQSTTVGGRRGRGNCGPSAVELIRCWLSRAYRRRKVLSISQGKSMVEEEGNEEWQAPKKASHRHGVVVFWELAARTGNQLGQKREH